MARDLIWIFSQWPYHIIHALPGIEAASPHLMPVKGDVVALKTDRNQIIAK